MPSLKTVAELKSTLIELGIYEDGMSVTQMRKIYKTIKASQLTADKENKYRELLSNTEKNCANIQHMIPQNDNASPELLEKDSVLSEYFDMDTNLKIDAQKLKFPVKYITFTSTLLNLSIKDRVAAIYNRNKQEQTLNEKFLKTLKNIAPWGPPIVPRLKAKFTNDLSIKPASPLKNDDDIIPTNTEERVAQEVNLEENSETPDLKSRLRAKRICYTYSTSEDEAEGVTIKKTKISENKKVADANNDTNSKTTSSWIDTRVRLSPANKLFDDMKKKNNESNIEIEESISDTDPLAVERETNNNTSQSAMELSSDAQGDEDLSIFSEGNTSTPKKTYTFGDAMIHASKGGKGEAKKKGLVKPREGIHGVTGVPGTSKEDDNMNSTQIPPRKFYGTRSNYYTANNNDAPTNLVECPLCSKTFRSTVIEEHASSCSLNMEDEPKRHCDVCNEYVSPNTDMDIHRNACIRLHVSDSYESNTKQNHKDTKQGSNLCAICDKYIPNNVDFNKHIGECISKDMS